MTTVNYKTTHMSSQQGNYAGCLSCAVAHAISLPDCRCSGILWHVTFYAAH